MSEQASILSQSLIPPTAFSPDAHTSLTATTIQPSTLFAKTALPKIAYSSVASMLGVDTLCSLARHVQGSKTGAELAQRSLDALKISVDADFAHVPTTGALVLVANHPFGMLEGLVLMASLSKVRPDVRLLANNMLEHVADLDGLQALSDFLLPIDVSENAQQQNSLPSLRHAIKHLQQGKSLVIFPAGTVSHWQKGHGICDPSWRNTALRLSEHTNAPIVPLYFAGRNSVPFSVAGLVHPKLRTLLLGRELLNKRNKTIFVRSGAAIANDVLALLPSTALRTDYLRMRCYALRDPKLARKQDSPMQAIAQAQSPDVLCDALAQLPQEAHLFDQDDYSVYVFAGQDSPLLLNEIGRCREETFRPCGEGTGFARDLDRFDQRYHHLVLWHKKDKTIAGAYRLGLAPALLSESNNDASALYSASLFQFTPTFLKEYAQQGLELGRALVTSSYQKDFFPLLLLWKGIASFVERYNLRYLFGPASLSLDASRNSLRLITTLLASQYNAPFLEGLVKGRSFLPKSKIDSAEHAVLAAIRKGTLDFRSVDKLVRAQDNGRGIPILFKHYLQLDGRIAAFNCDYSFNTLDAFLFVDLPKAPLAKLRRYMGDQKAKDYVSRFIH